MWLSSPINGVWAGQGGGFSPFLFGLVLGVTIFSAATMQVAKKQLIYYQEHQAERAKREATDVASAMDFAILTESKDSYTDDYTLRRARNYSSAVAKTRGDQDFMVTARQNTGDEVFGKQDSKVAITATDDTLLRSQVYRADSGKELLKIGAGGKPIVVYDTSDARDRQVRTSLTRMESLAEQVFAYYAGHMKFPTSTEYDELQQKLAIKDSWGESYDYQVAPDQTTAKLSFTTPWGYTREVNLSLKDGPEAAQ